MFTSSPGEAVWETYGGGVLHGNTTRWVDAGFYVDFTINWLNNPSRKSLTHYLSIWVNGVPLKGIRDNDDVAESAMIQGF